MNATLPFFMRSRLRESCTLLALLALFACVFAPTLAVAAQPNILLILADDMGYGDPSCYNPQSKIPTPNIDRLAWEGMRFTDAHAPGPLCVPSRYGLLTGRHPFRPDAVGGGGKHALIKPGQATLASVLKAQGYRTAMVGKWHLGFDANDYDQPMTGGPVDRGFDTFFGFPASTDIPPYFFIRANRAVAAPSEHIAEHHTPGWTEIQGEYWREGGIAPGLALTDVLPRLTEEAESVVREQARSDGRQPLFLYLALTAPHTPWLPASEFRCKSGAEMYGAFVMMVDAMIGRVLKALDDTKLADNTLIIFTSDNGPVWYPEDAQRTGHDSVGGWRGMKNSNWEGGHRMPFIVRWPGVVKPDSVSDQIVCFTDLMATLAEVTEAKLPADAGPDSFSFLPVLLGSQQKKQPIRESLVIGNSIRSGPWKWIEDREPVRFGDKSAGVYPPESEPAGQLYYLADDPRETKNLAAEKPDVVTRLKAELERIKKATRTRP